MLFNNFPTVEYRFKNLRTISILDIFRSVKFTKKTLNSTVVFDTYSISDGDTPESISEMILLILTKSGPDTLHRKLQDHPNFTLGSLSFLMKQQKLKKEI